MDVYLEQMLIPLIANMFASDCMTLNKLWICTLGIKLRQDKILLNIVWHCWSRAEWLMHLPLAFTRSDAL
jgi:hypothetical protein